MERIAPLLTLVSSARESPRYNFPHTIAQEIVRGILLIGVFATLGILLFGQTKGEYGYVRQTFGAANVLSVGSSCAVGGIAMVALWFGDRNPQWVI